ncbi:hypothetical protein K439DRAFT_1624715 [Ramaria rubella]|nr:hypothetical protein K439DRAFT_1624715 [Ramaria rubella]
MAHPGNHIPTAHLRVQPLASMFHVSTLQPISYPPTLPPLPPSPPSAPNRHDKLVQWQQQLEWHMGMLASTCQAMQSTQKEILSYLQVLGNANTGNIQISEDIQSTCSQLARTTPQEPWEVVPRPHQKTDEERYLALKSSASDEEVHNYVVEDSLGPTTEGSFCFAYQHEQHHQWNLAAGNFLAHGFMIALTKQWTTGSIHKAIYDFKDAWKEAAMSPELREKHKQERQLIARVQLETCAQNPDLEPFADIVNKLGTAGMSGDETDIEETPARPNEPLCQQHHFRRVELGFRSAEVPEVLHTIDHRYREHRALQLGNARPRNMPCERILEPLRTDWTKEVPGLPRNFYNKTWLLQLSAPRCAALKEVDDWSPAYL